MKGLLFRLVLFAGTIYFGGTLLGNTFGPGGLGNLRDIRDQLAANDVVHDTVSAARGYTAATSKDLVASVEDLVESIEAHRTEIDELRARLCSMLKC